MELSEFLLARIAEDEAKARAATQGSWSVESRGGVDILSGEGWSEIEVNFGDPAERAGLMMGDHETALSDATHIARWDPARVRAKCAADRRIVEWEWQPVIWDVLKFLALPYADHPDYREEWRP